MFGRSKPVAFEPYGRRRSRGRPPRWLVLLLIGTAFGASAVLFVQARYLPERLTPEASAELRQARDSAEAARAKLAAQLEATEKRLAAASAESQRLTAELAKSRPTIDALREDLAALVATLPPDPRGGAVELRAGRLTAQNGALAYELVLTRPRGAGKPLDAALRFSIAGESARSGAASVNAPPVAVAIGAQQVLRGTLTLPEGFNARQATIQVFDRAGGKPLGMRVLRVG